MQTIDLDKVTAACFSDDLIRGRICSDFGIENRGTEQDLAGKLIEALGQRAPAGHSWESRLENRRVFQAAVFAIGSNSRKWATFLKHERRLAHLLSEYDPAAVRASLRSGPSIEDDIRKCLPGQTVRGDARAVLQWAELLGDGAHYYDGLIDLRRKVATLPHVRENEVVPVVAGILGVRTKTVGKRWPPPDGLETWKAPGMGFVLACEFLRNLYWDTFKPDRHIQRLFSGWFPEGVDGSERRALALAEVIGSRRATLVGPLSFSLLGMDVTPPGRSFNEVDNLVWALGAYVEETGKESAVDYVAGRTR